MREALASCGRKPRRATSAGSARGDRENGRIVGRGCQPGRNAKGPDGARRDSGDHPSGGRSR